MSYTQKILSKYPEFDFHKAESLKPAFYSHSASSSYLKHVQEIKDYIKLQEATPANLEALRLLEELPNLSNPTLTNVLLVLIAIPAYGVMLHNIDVISKSIFDIFKIFFSWWY